MRLSNSSLANLPNNVAIPAYDRSRLTAGIVHIGVGNFHRAHMARYMDDLFAMGLDQDWAILGAGVRPGDAAMRDKLEAQDWLTTAVELGPDGMRAQVVGSMVGFVPVEADNQALIRAMSDPAIRIVSLTVTEGGYYIDPATQQFDAGHADIQHDVQNPDRPRTAFGAMVAALKARRAAGQAPFTGLSCDNVPGNGSILRATVVTLARLTDPDLARWIDDEGAFPNSMVDSIAPATGPKELALVRERFGIEDAAPVTHEPFRQWVIEDRFCLGRPRWEEAGVTLTDQVHDYELMKIRILNGGHAAICYPAALLDLEIVSGAMADQRIRRFFRKVEQDEMVPHVQAVPGMTPLAYLDLIESRFSNPAIVDTTRRLAFDGLEPTAQVHLAGGRGRLRRRHAGRGAGTRLGCVEQILLRHDGKRPGDRGQRSHLGRPEGAGSRCAGPARALARHAPDLRRPGREAPLRGRIRTLAAFDPR